MAEPTPEFIAALCAALAAPLAAELGKGAVQLVDVSSRALPWDIEARDSTGACCLRHISLVSTISQGMAHAAAKIGRSFVPELERHLQEMQVRGVLIGLHARKLPTGKPARDRLAFQAAQQIARHVKSGRPEAELWSQEERLYALGLPQSEAPDLLPLYQAIRSHLKNTYVAG